MCIRTFFITLCNQYVGSDQYDNKYYTSKSKDYLGRNKRFVVYNGLAEPSKVPPLWHAWLHHLLDDLPSAVEQVNHKWQKEFKPNLTGTEHAYQPVKGKLSADYQPWQPS